MDTADVLNTRLQTLPGECINCGAAIRVPALSWAYAAAGDPRVREGRSASGFDGHAWVWSVTIRHEDGRRDFQDITVPHHEVVEAVNGPHRCDKCQDEIDAARERASACDSPFPPRDFDPAYAGESWDEV